MIASETARIVVWVMLLMLREEYSSDEYEDGEEFEKMETNKDGRTLKLSRHAEHS